MNDAWRVNIEKCLDLLRGAEIEAAEAEIPVYHGKEYDRVNAVRIKIKGGPWLRIDHWAEYAGDSGIEIEVES